MLDSTSKVQMFERVLKGLAAKVGGDLAATDASRVLRLPGTTNFPNAKKVAAGLAAQPCKFFVRNTHPQQKFEDFLEFEVSPAVSAVLTGEPVELHGSLSHPVISAIKSRRSVRDLFERRSNLPSPSEVDYALACNLLRAGVSGAETVQALYASRLKAGIIDEKLNRIDYYALTVEKASDKIVKGSQQASTPEFRRMCDVQAEPVEWIWRGYLPEGKLTILDGDPGTGKSLIATDLAARVTTGREMPDGDGGGAPGGVVYLCCEDGLADTVKPRLEVAKADSKKIIVFESVRDAGGATRLPSIPEDLGHLEAVVDEIGARLVIVDPLFAYLSARSDSNSDPHVRRALTPLARLADNKGVAVLAIRHFNKNENQKALYRGGGSIAFTALARVALLVGQDPTDPDARVLAVAKCNLERAPKAMGYRVAATELGEMSVPQRSS